MFKIDGDISLQRSKYSIRVIGILLGYISLEKGRLFEKNTSSQLHMDFAKYDKNVQDRSLFVWL
jgi:hypothetical protein